MGVTTDYSAAKDVTITLASISESVAQFDWAVRSVVLAALEAGRSFAGEMQPTRPEPLPYSGPPRNRHERRKAHALARRSR